MSVISNLSSKTDPIAICSLHYYFFAYPPFKIAFFLKFVCCLNIGRYRNFVRAYIIRLHAVSRFDLKAESLRPRTALVQRTALIKLRGLHASAAVD